MDSGLKISDIEIGRVYGYWVWLATQNNFDVQDLCCGVCIKKGKKKAAILLNHIKIIKWKYPEELRLCE